MKYIDVQQVLVEKDYSKSEHAVFIFLSSISLNIPVNKCHVNVKSVLFIVSTNLEKILINHFSLRVKACSLDYRCRRQFHAVWLLLKNY